MFCRAATGAHMLSCVQRGGQARRLERCCQRCCQRSWLPKVRADQVRLLTVRHADERKNTRQLFRKPNTQSEALARCSPWPLCRPPAPCPDPNGRGLLLLLLLLLLMLLLLPLLLLLVLLLLMLLPVASPAMTVGEGTSGSFHRRCAWLMHG